MFDCFISYHSADIAYAQHVFDRLVEAGLAAERLWFDRARLRVGCDWHAEIEAGADESRVVLPVLTPRWQESEWTRFETYGAEKVIPVLAEGDVSNVVPGPLRGVQVHRIDVAASTERAAWAELAATITAISSTPVPEKAPRVAQLRFLSNSYFVGRERDLVKIHEELHGTPRPQLTQGRVCAIAALGGVGKTTLAREYAEKYWRCYPQMLWVDASSREGLESEMARVFEALFPTNTEDLKDAEKARRALRELNGRTERLLIIDNADDEAAVGKWIPKAGGCRTLVTSRFASWSAGVRTVGIEVLAPAAARQLLASRGLGRPATEREATACDELARTLGFLPLALEQAAAYVEQQQISFDDYLALYRRATVDLLREGVLGSTEYPDAVATTWKTTIARLPSEGRALLRLTAFLAAAPIPIDLFLDGADLLLEATGMFSSEQPAEPADDEVFVRRAIHQLARYSLARPSGEVFSVHGLVQTVERLTLPNPDAALWTDRASRLIETCPEPADDPALWPFLRLASVHLSTVAGHGRSRLEQGVEDAKLAENVIRTLAYVGQYETGIGSFGAAEQRFRTALALNARLPPEPRREVRAVHGLAVLLEQTERLDEAEAARRRELALYEAALGPEHVDVAEPLLRLARLLIQRGRWQEAEVQLQRALVLVDQSPSEPRAASLGCDCLLALHGLYDDQERAADVERIKRRLREVERKIPEEQQLFFASALADRALACIDAGDLEQGLTLTDQFLMQNRKRFGADSDAFVLALGNAAIRYQRAGRFARAEEALREACAIRERVLGPTHLWFAESKEELADLLDDEPGHDPEIEDLLRAALEIRDHALPAGHTTIGDTLMRLIRPLDRQKRFGEAERAARRAFSIFDAALGPLHPSTANSRLALVRVLLQTGRPDEGSSVLAPAVAAYERLYGASSPAFASALRRWSEAALELGQPRFAEPLIRRSLLLHEALHGELSAELLPDLDHLAFVLHETGKGHEALPLLRRMVAIAERSLGTNHLDTAHHQCMLGIVLHQHSELIEAESVLSRSLATLEERGSEAPPTDLAITQLSYADVLCDLGRFVDALVPAERVLRTYLRIGAQEGRLHGSVAPTIDLYVRCREAAGSKRESALLDVLRLCDEAGAPRPF